MSERSRSISRAAWRQAVQLPQAGVRMGNVLYGTAAFVIDGRSLPTGYASGAHEFTRTLFPGIELPRVSESIEVVRSPLNGRPIECGFYGFDDFPDKVPILKYNGYMGTVMNSRKENRIISTTTNMPVVDLNAPGYDRSRGLTRLQKDAFNESPQAGFLNMADAEIAILEARGITKVAIVGQSMGTMRAMATAVRLKETGVLDVESLVVFNPLLAPYSQLSRLVKSLHHAQRENRYIAEERSIIQNALKTGRTVINTVKIPLNDHYLLYAHALARRGFLDLAEQYGRRFCQIRGTHDELNDQLEVADMVSPSGRLGALVASGVCIDIPVINEGHAMTANACRYAAWISSLFVDNRRLSSA